MVCGGWGCVSAEYSPWRIPGPVHEGNEAHQGDHSGRGMRRNARSSQPAEEKWPAGYGDHGTSL